MIELGVNVDHVATVRQARRTYEPDPVWAAVEAHLGGADGITVHLREDRRHIQDDDVRRLREQVHVKLNLELAATGTAFQHAVWDALLEIPYGETRSYGEIARAIGQPQAARGVGAANGANPIGLIVPCHRVIGADGSLTGYGGGLPLKRALLAHEATHRPAELRRTASLL